MKKIGIIGAGTMGRGIAMVAAMNQFEVILHDVSPQARASALNHISKELERYAAKGIIKKSDASKIVSRITAISSFQSFRSCSIVIEAIVEDLEKKKALFVKLDSICSPATLLATNTSSLSVSAIASGVKHPERVIGLHFFNPVQRMELIEIIKATRTTDSTTSAAFKFVTQLNKTPIVVNDTPGFIVNRVARPFYGEALKLLGEGVSTIEEIDRIMRLEGGFKLGPFELIDLIGIDVNLAVTKSIYEQTFHEPRYRPHIIQQRMVDSGKLGKKTENGFYSYKG